MIDTIFSIVVLAAVLLIAAAVFLYRKGETKHATLMAILAFVMLANVAIWLIPTDDGDTLGERAATVQ